MIDVLNDFVEEHIAKINIGMFSVDII